VAARAAVALEIKTVRGVCHGEHYKRERAPHPYRIIWV
jgi:hypothetical protein